MYHNMIKVLTLI